MTSVNTIKLENNSHGSVADHSFILLHDPQHCMSILSVNDRLRASMKNAR